MNGNKKQIWGAGMQKGIGRGVPYSEQFI